MVESDRIKRHPPTSREKMFLFLLPPNTYFTSSVRLVCQNLVQFHIVTDLKGKNFFLIKIMQKIYNVELSGKNPNTLLAFINNVLEKGLKQKPVMVSNFENVFASHNFTNI